MRRNREINCIFVGYGSWFTIGKDEKSCCRALWRLVLNPKEGGNEKVPSDIRRVIEEIEKMRRQIRNSKLKIRRRIKKLEKTFDPLEKGLIEFEIEMLEGKIRRWEIVESMLNVSMMNVAILERGLEGEIDWSKAGRA